MFNLLLLHESPFKQIFQKTAKGFISNNSEFDKIYISAHVSPLLLDIGMTAKPFIIYSQSCMSFYIIIKFLLLLTLFFFVENLFCYSLSLPVCFLCHSNLLL